MVKAKQQKLSKKHPQIKKQGKQADTSQFRAQLDALGLKIVEVTADGNCFFRALANQLEGNEEEHQKYHSMVVQHIMDNREMFEPFIEDDVPFDEYCQSMENDGTWAGHMELQAASLVTHSNICIHRNMSPRWYIRNFDDRGARMIHLSYHDGEHYNSVRLKDDPGDWPARSIVIKILLQVNGDVDAAIEYLIAEQGMEECSAKSDSLPNQADTSNGNGKQVVMKLRTRSNTKKTHWRRPLLIIQTTAPGRPMTIIYCNRMTRRFLETSSAHVGQKRNTKLVVDQPQGNNLLSLQLTKQVSPERVEKKGSKETKGFLLKLEHHVNMTEWHLTWVHFVFDVDSKKKRRDTIALPSDMEHSSFWCNMTPFLLGVADKKVAIHFTLLICRLFSHN